jgi:ADP-ribosylglycohydrolase
MTTDVNLRNLLQPVIGSLVEFQSKKAIERDYPGGVRNLADGGTWNTIAGQPTDDSELALDLARTLIGLKAWSSETDTNAAICGALLGSSQGSSLIPVRWTIAVLACRSLAEAGAKQPRPAQYWPDDVPLLAEALLMRRRPIA